MNDKWTILLTGPNNGLVGDLGESFENSPCHYERVDVVRADLYHRLRKALALVVDQWTNGDGTFGSIEQARALLAELGNLEQAK